MRKDVDGDNPFSMDEYGYIKYQGRIWFPEDEFLKSFVLSKLHNS